MKKVNVPEGVSGDWRVEKFTISKDDAHFSLFSYGFRAPSPGDYTRLMRGRTVVMSDTNAEMRDHSEAVYMAGVMGGNVLINGLGIGMVLLNCMEKENVGKVTVIERSGDVISLVGPYYQALYGDRLEIVCADAMEHKPPKGIRYGMVWHDIWDSICGDNYDQMKTLHRRYGRKADWQGSWCKEETRRAA